MGVNPTGTDFLCPFRQPPYHLFLKLRGLDHFRVEVCLGNGQTKHIRCLDVGNLLEGSHQLRQVIKLGKPGFCPVACALGNEFVKMISLIFLNLTNRLKRNLPEPRVCIYP